MNTIYTVEYFIKKFEAIPESQWCIGERMDPFGRRCAHGHCYTGVPANNQNAEERALSSLARHIDLNGLGPINNGWHPDYKQPTPKQRILAALYDIKAKQQPEVKERIVYVTVDEKVRELQKTELSLS